MGFLGLVVVVDLMVEMVDEVTRVEVVEEVIGFEIYEVIFDIK